MKKRIWGIMLAMCMLAALVTYVQAVAIVDSGSCGENAEWTLDSAGTLTISGTGKVDYIVLNEDNSDVVYKIIIKDGITEIGNDIIWLYNNLTDVEMADSVQIIGDGNFSDCEKLETVKLSNGLREIGEDAFSGSWDNFKKIYIPAGVTKIGVSSFRGNNSLDISVSSENNNFSSLNGALFNKDKTELIKYAKDYLQPEYTVPNTVTNIGNEAFRECYYLTKITIPRSVVNIGDAAFLECRKLSDITIPNSVTSIGSEVFYNCESLEKFVIPDSITEISNDMFRYCHKLKDVTIPNSVTKIGEGAFDWCTNLTTLILPNSITEIGGAAFYQSAIENITLPDNLTYLGGGIFTDTPIEKNEDNWENGMFYFQDYLLDVDFSVPSICEIREGTKMISASAFFRSVDVKKITIPSSVKFIGDYAFGGLLLYLKDVYYGGTEQQWNNINIYTEGNEPLLNAQIHFNSPTIPRPKIVGTPTVKQISPGIFLATVPLEDVEYDSKIVASFYSGNRLAGSNSGTLTDGDTSKSLTINADNATSAKMFIWDSLSGMKPLCEAKIINIDDHN